MKKKYYTIAKSLGIILPACLLASPTEAKAADNVNNGVAIINDSQNQLNLIKDRIIQSYNEEPQTTLFQIDHTNLHANHKYPHSNVHADYVVNKQHTNDHSNTPPTHVNDHSNSPL